MKISFKHQAKERKNSEVCSVTEHVVINDAALDFAIITISGRYPEKGQASNKLCKEIVYVSEGSGKVVVNQEEYTLNSGDVVLIEPGEKFFWDGNMSLFISCTPAFTIEQHEVEDA